MIARTFYQGYFIHSLSTLHYCNAPSLATQLTGDYRDRTYTGKCGPASLDTLQNKRTNSKTLALQSVLSTFYLKNFLFLSFFSSPEFLFSMFFTASRELPVSISNFFKSSFASLESFSGT